MKNKKRFKHWLNSTKAKRLFSFCRWLHIYISTALFTLLVFFCFTGITLNHPQWLGKQPAKIEQYKLPQNLIAQIKSAPNLPVTAIQTYIEQYTGLTKPRSIDISPDFGEVAFDYPIPAGYVFVTVFSMENNFEIEHKQGSFWILLNDLHKGRYTGSVWRWLIDISALLILFFSITGILILLQNAKHRQKGFMVLMLGSLTPVFLYLLFVPQL